MRKADLISEVAMSTGYDKKTVTVITEGLMKEIKKNMAKGEEVYLRGFGSFVLKARKERMARDITARTSVFVPAHCVPDFKPAAEFCEAVHDLKLTKKAKKA